MDSLPIDVLIPIAASLNGVDLASWCAVSHYYRDCLNLDVFWKWRCDPRTAEYLRQTPCQVQPFFVSPEEENSGLSAISDWRLAFMREVHLWNNWRNNRFNIAFLSSLSFSEFDIFFNEVFFEIYNNDWIIACVEYRLQLWNVEGLPVLTTEKALPSHEMITLFAMSHDSVVVKQRNLVQMYAVSTAERELVFKHSLVTSDTRYLALRDNTLVEVLNNPVAVQVWNIESKEKVGEHRTENDRLVVHNHPCLSESFIVIQTSPLHEWRRVYRFLVYKLPDVVLVFTSKPYKYIEGISILKDKVFIETSTFFDIYCLETNQLISKVDVSSCSNVVAFNSHLCFADVYRNVVKLSFSSGAVQRIDTNIGHNEDRYMIRDFRVLSPKYSVVGAENEDEGTFRFSIRFVQINNEQESSVRELNVISDFLVLKPNKANTKLITTAYENLHSSYQSENSPLAVLSFW